LCIKIECNHNVSHTTAAEADDMAGGGRKRLKDGWLKPRQNLASKLA